MVFIVISAFWASRGQFKRWGELKSGWAPHRVEILTVAGIVLVALLARTVYLSSHPYPWSGDEASVGSEGRRIINGEVTNFFDTGWSGQPNWSFVPTALSMRIFGEGILAIRLVSALSGVLAVVFVYLLGKETFNQEVGWLAAGFLAVYPIHVHFSRIGVNNINDSFMVVLVLWLVFRATRIGSLSAYALAGGASGLDLYNYLGTRLVLILALGGPV